MAQLYTEAYLKEEDKEEFKKRNAKLAAYYDAIHPWKGQDLDGGSMTGESCADMAGMKVCLKIADEKEDFDYDEFLDQYGITEGDNMYLAPGDRVNIW